MSPQDFENLKNDFRPLPYDCTYVYREKSFGISHKHAYRYSTSSIKLFRRKIIQLLNYRHREVSFFLNHLFTHVEFDLNYELTTSHIRIVPYSAVNIEHYNFFN